MKKVSTHMLTPQKSVGFLLRLGGMCLFLFTSFLVHAQHRAVSGTVENESGQPSSLALTNAVDADGRHVTCPIVIESEPNQTNL